MKIEALFENQNLTLEAVKQELKQEFPDVKLADRELQALAQVHLLRKARDLISTEGDNVSMTIWDALESRALEITQTDDYLNALKKIDAWE